MLARSTGTARKSSASKDRTGGHAGENSSTQWLDSGPDMVD